MNRLARFIAGNFLLAFALLAPINLYAACTSPAAAAGSLNWNSGTSVFQYCDGTNWQNFASQWTTTGSNIYYTTGAVGIGNNSPAYTLDVAGATNGTFRLTSPTTNYVISDLANGGGSLRTGVERSTGGALFTGSSNYAGVVGTTGATPLQFGTNANIRATIDSSGNVGIGTVTPGTKLDVNGSIQIANGQNLIFNNASDSGINFYGGVTTVNRRGSDGSLLLNSGQANIVITPAVNTVFASGNVGIGTTGPGAPLEIRGTSAGYASNAGNLALTTAGSTNGLRFGVYDSNYAWISSFNSLPLYVNTGGNNIILNATSGNVGIGTTSPGNKLDVKGGTGTSDATTDGLVLSTTNTTYTNKTRLASNYDAAYLSQNAYFNGSAWVADNTSRAPALISLLANNADSSITFFTSATNNSGAGTQRMVIDKNGNVGIGTASPAAPLHVYGGTSWTSNGWTRGLLVNNAIQLRYGSGTRWGIASDGNFNIFRATVDDTSSTSNYAFYIDGTTGNTTIGAYGGAGSQLGVYGGAAIGTTYYASAAPTNGLIVEGNVNIGTTGQAYKLYVNGTTRLQGNTTIIGTIFISGIANSAGDSYLCYNTGTGFASWNGAGCNVSDARLKKNIQTLENPLDKIAQLRGVTFEWKKETKAHYGPQIGFIAQEVEKVFPSVVATGSDGTKSVGYDKLVAPLVEGVKALKTMFDSDHEALAKLEADNDNLRHEVEELRREVHAR